MYKNSNTDNAWSDYADGKSNTPTAPIGVYSGKKEQDNERERGFNKDYKAGIYEERDRKVRYDDQRDVDRKVRYDDQRDADRKVRYDERREGDRKVRYDERREGDMHPRRDEPRRYEESQEVRSMDRRPRYMERRRYDDPSRDIGYNRYDDRRRYDSYRGEDRGGRYEDARMGRMNRYETRGYRSYNDNYNGGYDSYNGGYNSMRRYNNDGYGRYDNRRGEVYNHKRARREDDAPPNVTIGLFNLNRDTSQSELDDLLSANLGESCGRYVSKIIIDMITGKCRGFGFVTFESIEESSMAKEKLQGVDFLGSELRVAFTIGDKKAVATNASNNGDMNGQNEGEREEIKEEFNVKND